MIDTDALRKKVIDLAIQGKLTEQLPEDGDAETLYSRIQEEKKAILDLRGGRIDKIVKDGDEEKPFEIPNDWKWIRLGEVGLFKKGPFGSALTKSLFVPKSVNAVKVYEQQHAIKKDASLGTYYISREYFETNMTGFEVLGGDIIVSCAGTIGETYIMPNKIEQGIINQALMRVTLVDSILKEFFLYYFDSNLKNSARNESNGMAIKNIPPFDVLKNWFFPLPPFDEQKRIVNKIDEMFAQIDIIDDLQSQYNNDLEVLKSKIIDAGIQGKLTEQLPEDGDAETLYEQIREEKAKLIKEGKIKKEKLLPEIQEDEIPFEIPKNWKWVRISEVVDVRDGTHDSPQYKEQGIPLVTSKNLSTGKLDFDNVKFISKEDALKINERSSVDNGDILFAMIGTIGNPVMVKKECEFCIKNVALFKKYPDINILSEYVYFFLMREQGVFKKIVSGGLQPFISLKQFRIHLMPLPPLAEQGRIAEKIDTILQQIKV
jgi:type I restriction enzyme S subunit